MKMFKHCAQYRAILREIGDDTSGRYVSIYKVFGEDEDGKRLGMTDCGISHSSLRAERYMTQGMHKLPFIPEKDIRPCGIIDGMLIKGPNWRPFRRFY